MKLSQVMNLTVILIVIISFIIATILVLPDQISTTTNKPTCQPALSSLPEVDQFVQCKNITGQLISRYYDSTNDWTIELIDGTFAPNYKLICQNNIDPAKCESLLKPQDCVAPSLPVARKGAAYAYVSINGRVNCF
jgi:hypothetical protein